MQQQYTNRVTESSFTPVSERWCHNPAITEARTQPPLFSTKGKPSKALLIISVFFNITFNVEFHSML